MAVAVVGEKPSPEECLYRGRFRAANEQAKYVGSFARLSAHLTADRLWLRKDLCIPLSAISGATIIRKGLLIPRYALQIVFTNPVSGEVDATYLCDMSILGFYRKSRLLEFESTLRTAVDAHAEGSEEESAWASPPRPAKSMGLVKGLASQIKLVFAPRNVIVRSICESTVATLAPDEATDGRTIDDLMARTEELMRSQDGVDANFDLGTHLTKLVRVQRLYAWWNLLWLLVLPLAVLLRWLAPELREEEFSSTTVIAVLVVSILGLLLLIGAGAIVVAALARPFGWLVHKLTGVKVLIHKARRYQ